MKNIGKKQDGMRRMNKPTSDRRVKGRSTFARKPASKRQGANTFALLYNRLKKNIVAVEHDRRNFGDKVFILRFWRKLAVLLKDVQQLRTLAKTADERKQIKTMRNSIDLRMTAALLSITAF
jgi:hypothetical protein